MIEVLKKMNITNKHEDIKSETTEHIKAEKQKLRVLKLKYKLVDEVYITYYITEKRKEEINEEDEEEDCTR